MLTPFRQSQFYNKNHENQFHTFTRPQTISIQHDAGETAVSLQFHHCPPPFGRACGGHLIGFWEVIRA